DGGFDFKPNKLIAYTDTGSCNNLIDRNDAGARIQLLQGLQEAYTGTTLKGVGEIKKVLDLDIDTNNPSQELLKYAGNFVNNNLGGKIVIDSNNLNGIIINGTFTLSESNVLQGTKINITDNCTQSPSGYISSNNSVATISGTIITTVGNGVTNITPIGGSCLDSNQKILTVQGAFINCTAAGQIFTSISRDSGCNANDITVCSGNQNGYILSACNVGASTSGTGSSSYGDYFQRGNNGGTPYGNKTLETSKVNASTYGPGTSNGYYNNSDFIGGNYFPVYDWINPQNNNLWGNTNITRQGPCTEGYHVPTTSEWDGVKNAGGWCQGSCNSNPDNGIGMMNALKLLKAGNRNWSNGVMGQQGTLAIYWTSTIRGFYIEGIPITDTNIGWNYYYRTEGYPVRCFRN
ncbi:MAG: hypothetical protein PHS49_07875, partial [Candidatus Gracilibacteria bacterium]|nr:hypothetical protein [Candidatus Gracilibacteria bacterium]